MTSTNDGKEVKNNLISGPKGKTYYIELYKSLESSLNESLPLPQRTVALCNAWHQVHSLCSHSAPSTHTHLLTWIQRHTATTVLQTEWRSASILKERNLLENAIDGFIVEANAAIVGRGDHLPWEKQLVPRAEWFKKLSSDPWGHAVLLRILDETAEQPNDEEVLDWLKEERGIVFVSRLRQLVASKCDDIALTLASAVMDRVRRTETLSPDYDDDERPLVESNNAQSFGDAMRTAAGFTQDVYELLIDIEFVLLDKLEKRKTFIDLAKRTPLKLCYQLAERLRTRLDTSPKEKRLWKNAKLVATTIAQVSIARCMVFGRCAGAARACLYWMSRALARGVARAALPAAAAVLAAPAASARHLHTFTAALHAESSSFYLAFCISQCADDMKPFICELYIRAITAGMNELERLKLKTEKDNETEARVQEALLASWFVSLGGVLSGSARIRAECDLTAFSLHPAPNNYERLKAQAPPPPLLQEKLEPKIESLTDFGSWANDSRANTNFVKTSETLNLKNTAHQINVVSTAILLEGEALGLSVELCQDLAVLLSGPRVKTFTWEMNREELLANCRAYMERTGGGTKALTTELKYLNLDPSQFQHLPEESDGEDDIYYGIEKGYESHLPEPERELEPEQIWAETLFDSERHSSIESDTEEYGSKKKSKKPVTLEEQDPLSLHTETKPKDVQKKERNQSKERSKKPKAKKPTEPKEVGVELRTKEQEDKIKKDMIKKEKKEKKQQEKLEKALAVSAHSINELVGVKVDQYDVSVLEAKTLKPYKERKKKTDDPEKKERKGKKHKDSAVSTTTSNADTHGVTSPEAGVVFDGLFSMEDLKTISPEKSSSEIILSRSLSQPLPPLFKPPSTVTETQTSTSTMKEGPEKKETKEEIKLRIAKLLSFRKERVKKISQHCANLKRLSHQFNSDATISTATTTPASTVTSIAPSTATPTIYGLPPPVTKSTDSQILTSNTKTYINPVSNQETISSPNISQNYRSPVNRKINSIDTQTNPPPLRVQNINSDNSRMNFRTESTTPTTPFVSNINPPINSMSVPVKKMAVPVKNMPVPVNNMANEPNPVNRSLSESRIPNILQKAHTPKQKTQKQKNTKQRNIGTPNAQPQTTSSSLNQQKVISMKDFLTEIQQSYNGGIQAESALGNSALTQDKLKHDALLNSLLNTQTIPVPIANRHPSGFIKTKVNPVSVADRSCTGTLSTKMIPMPVTNRHSTSLMDTKVIPVNAVNRASPAPQTTKASTKQKESAPNTFSRLSYMHKNKLDTKHNEGKLISQKEAISNELERHIAEFKLAKLQQQNQGSLIVQRGSLKADNNPVLANMLSSTDNKISFISQYKNTVSAKTTTKPSGTSNSAIDKELMNLFHQKAILNQTRLRPPSNHIAIKNDSQGPSFDNIKVSDGTNIQGTTYSAATKDKPQNNNHVLTSLDAQNATATVAMAPKSIKRMVKPRSRKARKGVLNALESIQPQIQKEFVQNVYPSKDAVTATFITKDKLKDPAKTEIEPQKQQNWASVMDQLLAQKTPSRGPNALNLALEKTKETNNATKHASTIKSSVIANVPMKQTCNFLISHDKSINIKKETCPSPKEHSQIKILNIQNFPVDQLRKHASKLEKSQHDVKKSQKPVIKPGSKLLLKNTPKPPVNKQINDEYAMLEELIDRDLQQEIDELTSDEDSNITPSQKVPKTPCKTYDKQIRRTVANQHISPTVSKASQLTMYSNNRPTCCNNETNKTIQNTDRVNEKVPQTYRQPSIIVTTHSSYIPIQNSVQNVIPQTYTITNQTNSNVVINVPVNLSSMLYVNPSVPCETYAIVQDNFILNSNPNVMLYPNSFSTPVSSHTVYQNKVINKQPSAETVDKMSAAESLISMGMPRQAHVDVSPNVEVVCNKQNEVQELYVNKAEDVLASKMLVTSPKTLEDATSAQNKNSSINSQNSYPHVNLSNEEAKQSFANASLKEDIVSQAKENIKAAPLEKSKSVFEILQKTHQESTLKRDPLDNERFATKRNNILNRLIHHKGMLEAIPLTFDYLPRKSNKENTLKNIDNTVSVYNADSNDLFPKSEAENKLPASKKLDEIVKETKETKPCRRILLRSSNSLKAPKSISKLTTTVKTAEKPDPIINRGKRQRRSKSVLPDKTLKKSPKNKKKTKESREFKNQKTCEGIKPESSIISELDFEEALTTSVIPKTEEVSSDNLSITYMSKELLLASSEPDELTNMELKTYDCANDTVKKEDESGNEKFTPTSTELKKSEPDKVDPHDILMQQNFTTKGVNLQVIRDIFDMDDDSSPISSQNEITNIVKEEVEEPEQTIPTIVNKVMDTPNELSTTHSKNTDLLICNEKIESVKTSTPLCNVDEEEYLKSIVVTHLYTKKRGERFEKCVRVKLPNNKSFKVTVSGNADLDMKSLLSNSDVRSIINSNWNEVKQFKLHVAHNSAISKVLNAQEIRHCPETIDLLSDEEPEKAKENDALSFKTESGSFKIGSIDTTTHKTHQDKLLCKTFVNLIRHPNAFFEKSILQQESQLISESETLTPALLNNVEVKDPETANKGVEKVSDQNSEFIDYLDTKTEIDTYVECTDNLYKPIEKHDYGIINKDLQGVEKKMVENVTEETIDHLSPQPDIDLQYDINKSEKVSSKSQENDTHDVNSNVDEGCAKIDEKITVNKLVEVAITRNQSQDVNSNGDLSFVSKMDEDKGLINISESHENTNHKIESNHDVGKNASEEVVYKDIENQNKEGNSILDVSLVSKTDEIQNQTNISNLIENASKSPDRENQQVQSNNDDNCSKNEHQGVNSDLKSISKIDENLVQILNKSKEMAHNNNKVENQEVISHNDASSVPQISCLIEGTNSNDFKDVNMPDSAIPDIITPKPDANLNTLDAVGAHSDIKRLLEAAKTEDKTVSGIIEDCLQVKHYVEEILNNRKEKVSNSDVIKISDIENIDGIHKKVGNDDGDIISISDGDERCDKLNTNMIDVNKTKMAEKIEGSQKLECRNPEKQEKEINLNIVDNKPINVIAKADAKEGIIASVFTKHTVMKDTVESIKKTNNLYLICHESLRDLSPTNKVDSAKKTEALRGLSLDSIVVTAGDHKKPTLLPSPFIPVLHHHNDQTVPIINAAEKDKNEIDLASSPILMTDIIELDDSSNDSLDGIIPDISKILENKLQELKTDITAPPTLAIDDLKNMLLDDLGVMAKPTLPSCEPIVLTSDEDEPVLVQQPKKLIKATKKKPIKATKQKPIKARKKVTNVRQLIKEARTRKCYIRLTRCDRKIPETILLDDDDDTDVGVGQVTSDEINVNIEESDDELTYIEPENAHRSESPSILNTLWPKPVIEISLTSPEPLQLEQESYDGKTSPVMEIYDELASLMSIDSPIVMFNDPLNCSAEWYETKRQIFRNAHCNPEEICLVYNVSTLSQLVLKLISQTETLISIKPKTKICRIRRLNPVKRKIYVSYYSNKRSKMAIDEVKPRDTENCVPEQSIEEGAKLPEVQEMSSEQACLEINVRIINIIEDNCLTQDPTSIVRSNDIDVTDEKGETPCDQEYSARTDKITEIIEDKYLTLDATATPTTGVHDMDVVESKPIKPFFEHENDGVKLPCIKNAVPETEEMSCDQECLAVDVKMTKIIEDKYPILNQTAAVENQVENMDVVVSTQNELIPEKVINELQPQNTENDVSGQCIETSINLSKKGEAPHDQECLAIKDKIIVDKYLTLNPTATDATGVHDKYVVQSTPSKTISEQAIDEFKLTFIDNVVSEGIILETEEMPCDQELAMTEIIGDKYLKTANIKTHVSDIDISTPNELFSEKTIDEVQDENHVTEKSREKPFKILQQELQCDQVFGLSNAKITETDDFNIDLVETTANELLSETKSKETVDVVEHKLQERTFEDVVSSNNTLEIVTQTSEGPVVEEPITEKENIVESTDKNNLATNECVAANLEKDEQHDVEDGDIDMIKSEKLINNILPAICCQTEWFETKSILSFEAKKAFKDIYDLLVKKSCEERDNNLPNLTVLEHDYYSVDSTTSQYSNYKEYDLNSAINDNHCLVTGINLSSSTSSRTNTPEVVIDGTFEIDNEINIICSAHLNFPTPLRDESPIARDIDKPLDTLEQNAVETCIHSAPNVENAVEIVESAIADVMDEIEDLSNVKNVDKTIESPNRGEMFESTGVLSVHGNLTISKESATDNTVGDIYEKIRIVTSDDIEIETEVSIAFDAEDDNTPLISPCGRSSNASNDVECELKCSTPLSEDGIVLKGIEIEDPLVGKCYIFRPIGDSASSDTDSLRNNDSPVIDTEGFNISTESVYETANEYEDGDDSQNSTVDSIISDSISSDSISSPITLIQDEKEIPLSQISPISINNRVEDLHDIDYNVITPKKTYLKTTYKRKFGMCDVKIPNKKYRKGKNIDTPKQTSLSIADMNYGKEYKNVMDYVDNLSFSYSIPFHKDYIDTEPMLQNWPTKVLISSPLISDDTRTVENMLFLDIQDMITNDPIDQSLDEEMSQNIEYEIENSVEIQDTNFKTGFGEGSGRVIKNFTREDDNSKFSAAALSDVKQNQPILMSEDCKDKCLHKYESSADVNVSKINKHLNYLNLREKVKVFFENIHKELIEEEVCNKLKGDYDSNDLLKNVPGLYETEFLVPAMNAQRVQVVQVGQAPVSAAAQNPVTCDPRVTQVSDASPSQCGDNSPESENNESNIKAEYTELTNADLSMVNLNKQIPPMTKTPQDEVNINAEQTSTSPIYQHIDSPNNGSHPNVDNSVLANSNNQIDMVYQFKRNVNESEIVDQDNVSRLQRNVSEPEIVSQDNVSSSGLMSTTTTTTSQIAQEMKSISSNGFSEKTDQIAHAMNAAGIAITSDANEISRPAVNLISQNFAANNVNVTTNNYQKAQLNTISLQQALAQILPQSLNQSINNNGNQQNPHNNVGPQVLHIVQGKNANGNHLTLLENNPQTVLNASNATQVLHLVQNKSANSGTISNGTPTIQSNSLGGLSLVDAGLQQGGNQLLHIVNTGAQKSQNANQLLKRVNLLTNLANVQGSNEQKMVQFVCKSADGKAIHLNAPQQQRMVLRLQPIENTTPAVQPQSKVSHDESSVLNKESSQQGMKTRSIYEENYTKYVQENPNASPGAEKGTSLPKFNQAFGKPLYQEGTSKDNEMNSSMLQMTSPEADGKSSENNINLNQLGSPPLLLRHTSVPSATNQTQQNIVQQLKQSIGPMNIQTMHGGVIYTRQIPVNLGGGQTINLITVPTTELMDESGQKQQSEKEPSIIKIVSQSQQQSTSANESNEDSATPTTSNENTAQTSQQTQPVLTHMRIKLPMLSKAPQMVGGARVVRPSFFQIQRNIVGGANQQVFQQYVLTTAPPLGQQTIRLPQAQVTRQVKVPTDSQSSSESHLSSSTLEQLREFDMVLEQVKERSTVQPGTPNSSTKQTDVTDSAAISTGESLNQSIIYSIGNHQTVNVAYVTRKPTVLTPTTCTFVRSPDSTAIDSPSTHIIHSTNDSSELNQIKSKIASKSMKSRSSKPLISSTANTIKVNPIPPKPSIQKPQEDEQTTQRILYILNEYKEQVENSPDKDKPAPRRRSNPPTNPSGSSKRKKGSGGSRRPGCTRDHSPVTGDDASRTMGSEDSSCGTSQGDCTENCSLETGSPQDSPRKVVRKLTFDQEATLVMQSRPAPPRNVIVADGQTITVARSSTPGKPATAVLMPSNYILPISMVKGGRQIAIVTNQGPKLLTVGGATGEGAAANALLLQRLIGGQAGLKPVLARPGVRHVRLPFNLTPSVTSATTTSISSPSSVPTPELVQSQASSPWAERNSSKPDNEQWNLQTSSDTQDYGYDTENVTSRSDNRTVLDSIPDRYSPDMEAQRIFDKMFDVDSKKSFADSHVESPRFDIQSDCDDRVYTQVVQRKDGSSHGLHRVTHISAAALRHKYAMLEHELKLQKSLSEECEDLGVDSPSASELFPEADLLFAASPAAHDDHTTASHTVPGQAVNQPAAPSSELDLEDQLAAEHLMAFRDSRQADLTELRLSVGGKEARPGRIDHEEFARAHPNTTFHTEPTDDVTQVQPYTLTTGLKSRHLTSTIFRAGPGPTTVLMSGPQSVIAQTHQDANSLPAVKYIENDADIDNIINLPSSHSEGNLSLVKDDGLTRYDILSDRELHLSNTASAIVHASGTQVIKRVCCDDDKRSFLMDETDIIAGNDAKMALAEEDSRDVLEPIVADDERSSPERPELFWESNSASERSVKHDFSSDSEKCCKSPSLDETNSTDSSGIGSHMRLDSVIKEARGRDRCGSVDGSSADDTVHPPLRTYPAKRSFHSEEERSLSGKTRAGECPDSPEIRRRSSIRGVVKRGCHCCNGSPTPSRKKPRQKKPTMDFNSN